MSIKITTSELLYINEAAKALKQKVFKIYNNTLIGMDNINDYVIYVDLDAKIYHNIDFNNFIINLRELSAFVKTIMLESEFELRNKEDGIYCINTMNGELNLINRVDLKSKVIPENQLAYVKSISNICIPLENEYIINNDISELFSMKRDSGCIYYNYKNKYYISLFSGILPLNKSDKVSLTIYPNDNHSFIAKFSVMKKKFTINAYLSYLYI
jgi:hypothetical protein